MLGASPWVSSYGEQPIFVQVLGTVHRSCECKSTCMRGALVIAAWVKGAIQACILTVFSPSVCQRLRMDAPNNSHFSPIIREINGGRSQVQSLLDGFSGDRPCFHRTTSADCRAAHSITGLTGCNPTCIPAPVASLGQRLGAQERSSATCSTLLIGLASDRPTSHPILQCSQTPTGGELRGDHRRQGGYQKTGVYFMAQYCLLYVWHLCFHGLVHSASCPSVGQLNVQHSPGWAGMQPRE